MDREILRLAVPAFGALVAEPMFLLADSAMVGHHRLSGRPGTRGMISQSLPGSPPYCTTPGYPTPSGRTLDRTASRRRRMLASRLTRTT